MSVDNAAEAPAIVDRMAADAVRSVGHGGSLRRTKLFADWRRLLLVPQRPLIEIAGVLALYLVYELCRGFVLGEASVARRHAEDIVGLERYLDLYGEAGVQHRLAAIPGLLAGLSFFYLAAHLTVTVAMMVWLYVRRPLLYARARTTLAFASFAALAGYWLFPAMPPRLAADGITDSVSEHTPVNLASAVLGRFYNPYAAVPSMHLGYALVVGILLARYGRRPILRAVGAAYPAIVLLAIVSTGNHYFFDAFAGAGVVGMAWLAVNLATRLVPVACEHDEPAQHPADQMTPVGWSREERQRCRLSRIPG